MKSLATCSEPQTGLFVDYDSEWGGWLRGFHSLTVFNARFGWMRPLERVDVRVCLLGVAMTVTYVYGVEWIKRRGEAA